MSSYFVPHTIAGTGIQQRTSPGPCPLVTYVPEGTRTVHGFMLWVTHTDRIHSGRVGWALGKAALTETKCWVSSLGLGGVSQVELRPQGFVPEEEGHCVCSAGRAGESGRWWGWRQARALPGPVGTENFGVVSRAVRSQGRFLIEKMRNSLSQLCLHPPP